MDRRKPEFMERLVEFYKKHPALYDPRVPNYHNRDVRNAALESVALDLTNCGMPTTATEVYSKFKSIRDQYVVKKRNSRIREASGLSSAGLRWKYGSLLVWLDEFIGHRIQLPINAPDMDDGSYQRVDPGEYGQEAHYTYGGDRLGGLGPEPTSDYRGHTVRLDCEAVERSLTDEPNFTAEPNCTAGPTTAPGLIKTEQDQHQADEILENTEPSDSTGFPESVLISETSEGLPDHIGSNQCCESSACSCDSTVERQTRRSGSQSLYNTGQGCNLLTTEGRKQDCTMTSISGVMTNRDRSVRSSEHTGGSSFDNPDDALVCADFSLTPQKDHRDGHPVGFNHNLIPPSILSQKRPYDTTESSMNGCNLGQPRKRLMPNSSGTLSRRQAAINNKSAASTLSASTLSASTLSTNTLGVSERENLSRTTSSEIPPQCCTPPLSVEKCVSQPIVSRRPHLLSKSSYTSGEGPVDEYDRFGAVVADICRRLPPRLYIRARSQVVNLLGCLEEDSLSKEPTAVIIEKSVNMGAHDGSIYVSDLETPGSSRNDNDDSDNFVKERCHGNQTRTHKQ